MAATETDVKMLVPSLFMLSWKALGDAPLTNPGFFNSREAPCPKLIKENLLTELLHCVGFGMRAKAKTIFMGYPELLLRRGTLTDIAKSTYEEITAFEYAVKAKDSYFVRNVINFLETYHDKDRHEIAADLLKQFDSRFSEECLASVNGFIEACNAWRTAFPNRTVPEQDYHFVQDVGGSQAHFEAHILQRYCNLTPFYPLPKFDEPALLENLSLANWGRGQVDSLLTQAPGGAGGFTLIRGRAEFRAWRARGRAVDVGWDPVVAGLEIDCTAVDALDKARTADLLSLRAQLEKLQSPVDSLESHAPTPGCSSSVPS